MTTTDRRTIVPVSLDLVDANPWQPRAAIDPEHLGAIAASIESIGLLQHPMVRPAGDRYQLAFGHVRTAAMRSLNWASAEMEVKDLSDEEMAHIALDENAKRKDITPIEQYRAWQKMLDEIPGLTIERLADKAGLARPTVSNNLRLLRLPAYILDRVNTGELSAHAAREFLALRGNDGHYHDDLAKGAMHGALNGGRKITVELFQNEISEQVRHQPTSALRPLFAGYGHGADPAFDVDDFKAQYGDRVHAIPWGNDKTREFTCATSAWVRLQKEAQSDTGTRAKAVVASSAPDATGDSRSRDWTKTLAQDPVFRTVSSETGGKPGTLIRAFEDKDATADQIREQLGTRAEPVLLNTTQFKAKVDTRELQYDDAPYHGSGRVDVPEYFPDLDECRSRCTIGATWARFDAKRPLFLYCLNESHFREKLEKGRSDLEQKLAKKVVPMDIEDADVFDQLHAAAATLPDDAPILRPVVDLLLDRAAHQANASADVAVWPQNAKRIFALLESSPPKQLDYWNRGRATGKLPENASPGVVKELLLRLLVSTHRNNPEAFDLAALTAALQATRPDEIPTKGEGIAANGGIDANGSSSPKRPAGRRTASPEDPDAPKLRSRAEQMMART